ncbi:hypothetical protein BDN72DRAFT_485780 [Pluteus cervinus]|uniref:Uncharacterized protein n=1 Tax=Pluteus cervinus TaxID=181527 RepID=A0ACD3A5R3_9AGAR|nr:hypothetical protein BDN72DRAFT_485780 [Pluteus cervinus]
MFSANEPYLDQIPRRRGPSPIHHQTTSPSHRLHCRPQKHRLTFEYDSKSPSSMGDLQRVIRCCPECCTRLHTQNTIWTRPTAGYSSSAPGGRRGTTMLASTRQGWLSACPTSWGYGFW